MPILIGLIVSIDALFIGVSLGMQRRCRLLHLATINGVLLGMCLVGWWAAGRLYGLLPVDPEWLVGFAFIALGLWVMRRPRGEAVKEASLSTIASVGAVMSAEAMLITMGITLAFGAHVAVPITVALAHFGYSLCTFYLARTKQVRRLPLLWCQVISGMALIIYGLMALFIEIGGI
jgi:putative Mn2+ efflux pump MntP